MQYYWGLALWLAYAHTYIVVFFLSKGLSVSLGGYVNIGGLFEGWTNNFFDVAVDKKGDFSEGYLAGTFSDKNNLSIYYRTGGLGGGGNYDITGIRK